MSIQVDQHTPCGDLAGETPRKSPSGGSDAFPLRPILGGSRPTRKPRHWAENGGAGRGVAGSAPPRDRFDDPIEHSHPPAAQRWVVLRAAGKSALE